MAWSQLRFADPAQPGLAGVSAPADSGGVNRLKKRSTAGRLPPILIAPARWASASGRPCHSVR